VRLQLDRDGRVVNYSAGAELNEQDVLETAPDLTIGENRVRLEGLRYRITVRLREEQGGSQVDGTFTLDASEARSLPPLVVHGARGWVSGYVVPVLSGRVDGELTIGRDNVSLDGASGYHDHNWGFWRGVRWQWGQVAGQGASFVYGRVFPPADVADSERMPGFLGVLGPDGLMGAATNVSIAEQDAGGAPREIRVVDRGTDLDVELRFSVDRVVRTQMAMTGATTDFLQLGGEYQVKGRAGGRSLEFTARGAAETFRQR
jgi:hypothetical protein